MKLGKQLICIQFLSMKDKHIKGIAAGMKSECIKQEDITFGTVQQKLSFVRPFCSKLE
jgi:hypothetical protein